jgi:hypothetical protein
MASQFWDLIGTTLAKLQIGIGGVNVKTMSGDLASRDAADAAYAAIRATLFKTFGNDFELNSGAAGSGADWKLTFSRPSTGMTHALQVIWPAGDPTANQAITVASLVGDVITLQYTTVAAGTDKIVVDTTTVAFGDSSPIAMFAKPANAVILSEEVIIDTAFDGTPTLSIGISGTLAKYGPTSAWDLTAANGGAKSSYVYHPNEPATSAESLIATLSAGGATVGSLRILTSYVIPS